MKIRLFLTIAFATLTLHSISAQEQDSSTSESKEIIKTGYNFGPLPAVAFDADKGFQLGALLNIYDFGNGENYPNTRQQ